MKYHNTRRAAMGAVAILILGAVITYRRWGQKQMTEGDYFLVGAAFFLIALNLGMSYYFDRQSYLKQQR